MKAPAKAARNRVAKKKTAKKRIRTQRANEPRPVRIFISYASEDRDLVAQIANLLEETFNFVIEIFRDVEIKTGANYAKAIDTALDKADVLLVIFTDQLKTSHSFTGYEIGYFNRSIKNHAKGVGGERIYLPLCIGADVPDPMHYIQGVSVKKDDVYKVIKSNENQKDDAVLRLLSRIGQLISTALNRPNPIDLKKPAAKLRGYIREYLQNRVWSETYPERKLIIRGERRPKLGHDGVDLNKCTVELSGDFSEIFQTSTRVQQSWGDFCDKLPDEIRTNTAAGIQYLVAGVLKGNGDNYHVVTSPNKDKSFRLFVSKVVTYVSQKTEIDVYVLQMRSKEYGDRETSRLLKAISVGLRFRFLLLEEQSEFRPEKLGHPVMGSPELKPKISELLGQLELILGDAADAELKDPDFLMRIWGRGQDEKMQKMLRDWEGSYSKLASDAEALLNAVGDEFNEKKRTFVQGLTAFCDSVEEMNREFTSRVLSLLGEHVQSRWKTKQATNSPKLAVAGGKSS